MYDPLEKCVHAFGVKINEKLADEWRLEDKEQLVTEAELLPLLLARNLWAEKMKHRKLINFIDSNPALFSCIRGSSNSENCNNIVKAICYKEAMLGVWPWYSRVPSLSNCADWPSRLKKMPKQWNGLDVLTYEPDQPVSLAEGKWKDCIK